MNDYSFIEKNGGSAYSGTAHGESGDFPVGITRKVLYVTGHFAKILALNPHP